MSLIGTTAATKGGSMLMNTLYVPFLACCVYLQLSWESMTLLGILLIIDYFTGIAKVYVIDKKDLKSYKAIAGVIAKSSILLIPLVLSIAAKQVGYDMGLFTDSIISMLILAETFSIIGNIRSIHTRKKVEEIDAISFVLNKISTVFEALLKKD